MQCPLRFTKLKRSETTMAANDEHVEMLCSIELQYEQLELELTKV